VTRDSDRNLPGNSHFEGVYSLAGYVMSGGANDGYYFGIRRVPYSTDFAKNALTFKHIQTGVPLPEAHPVNGPSDGSMNAEVHYSGEVWATMLWDCYVSLLEAHAFADAQERMKAYLVAAYKATPLSPTMLEARDALLAVAAASDAEDHRLFVQAFARRGAGVGAKGPDRDSGDHLGVVESYEAGNNLEVVSIQLDDAIAGCDKDGVLDEGETGRLTVTVRNSGLGALVAFQGNVSVASTSTFTLGSGAALSFSTLAPGETASASIPVTLNAVSIPPPATLATAGFSITFDESSLPTSARSATYDARLDYDDVAGVAATDSMDSALSRWTSTSIDGVEAWQRQRAGNRSVSHSRNLPVTGDVFLTSPWLSVKSTGSFEVVVTHRYSFESNWGYAPWFDGGVIEASLDGVYWYDVFSSLGAPLQEGLNYDANNSIGYQGSDNPLMYSSGFVGMSAGYPAFGVTRVGLGSILAGKQVQLRFRMGTDGGVGAYGWDIDSVEFKNVLETPFSAQVPEAAATGGGARICNQRPVARVGANQEVSEFLPDSDTRRTVQLDGSGSSDADGQLLGYQWRQVGGPAVTLSSTTVSRPTFTVDVPADTVYAFELVVDDGIDVSAPKLASVKVLNRNRLPIAVISAPQAVDERTVVTLDGSQSHDLDGDSITFAWGQMVETSGTPRVTLDRQLADKPTFTAPDVTQDTLLKFAMQVEDGWGWSEVAYVTVLVRHVDRAPVVEAGNAVSVRTGEAVRLTGTGSDPDGGLLTYAWTQHAGEPVVTLSGANTRSLSFTAPVVSSDTLLHFDLTLTSGGVSVMDTVEVTVKPANRAPVAQAPAVPDATSGATVTLAGQGTDADGDTVSFTWKQLQGPSVTLVGSETASAHFTAPDVASPTQLSFELVVKDAALESAPVTLTVTVTPRPATPPPAVAASGCSTSGSGSPLIALALLALGLGLRRRSVGEAAP
jgi:large repetitive protein